MIRATKSKYSQKFSALFTVYETATNQISQIKDSQIIRSKKVKINI